MTSFVHLHVEGNLGCSKSKRLSLSSITAASADTFTLVLIQLNKLKRKSQLRVFC
jgi:hypothetical protein